MECLILARKNNKEQLIAFENSIKKSNDLSMGKLSQGLSLNQMQLLAFSIYSTQQDGSTEFIKADFEKEFNLDEYRTGHANEDVKKLYDLGFATVDIENNSFDYLRVFQRISYDKGLFRFKWTDDMVPHILELKTYSLIDLTITSKFKSGFSWTLYEYLKAHYGNWHKELSKDGVMKLFNVEDRQTYQKNTNRFKGAVLDVAIEEINEHTEMEVWYTEVKKGRTITGFVLHWSTGKQLKGATEKQVTLLQEIYSEINNNMFDYLAVKDIEKARNYIIKAKDIHLKVKKGVSINAADELIKELLEYYQMLESLLELDGTKRDTSIYFNWLEEK